MRDRGNYSFFSFSSPFSSLLFPSFFLFPSHAPSDLQADSMEILPLLWHQFCAVRLFLVLHTGIFLVLHDRLGPQYSLYFSFAFAFWGVNSTGWYPRLAETGRRTQASQPVFLLSSRSTIIDHYDADAQQW